MAMRVERAFGDCSPALGVIGTWDPLGKAQLQLFRRVSRHAKRQDLRSLAIILHPAPSRLLYPSEPWPEFDDVHTRIAIMRECGLDAVLLVRFARKDIDASAREFFRAVAEHTALRELWLGSHQSLGRGPQGSFKAIAGIARRRRFTVSRLPVSRAFLRARAARELLLNGRVRDAAIMVGHTPIWRKPTSGVLRLAWKPGIYFAAHVHDPTAAPIARDALKLRLVKGLNGWAELCWPRRGYEWLAFIAGPADKTSA
jgi:FAD synthase